MAALQNEANLKHFIKTWTPPFLYRILQPVWRVLTLQGSGLTTFLIRERLIGFDVPTTPHFDSLETTEWFKKSLAGSAGYIEFGSGGSTCLAAQIGLPFVSVDSDRWFLRSVRKKIRSNGHLNESTQRYHYANIGLTGHWGWPVLARDPSPRRLRRFAHYSEPPSACLSQSFRPDLVLIDGRFRVACALKMLRHLESSGDWTILVDDYLERPGYRVIENYAGLERMVGRMAVFKSAASSRPSTDLDRAIEQYETIPD